MANQLSKEAESHANGKIASGDVDRESKWSFTTEDEDAMLGPKGDDWTEYGLWHLGRVSGADEKTKAAYKYPYGKNGKVYRSGLIAAKTRAAQQGDTSIADAADRLLQKIDAPKNKEKSDADMTPSVNNEENESMSLWSQIKAALGGNDEAKPEQVAAPQDTSGCEKCGGDMSKCPGGDACPMGMDAKAPCDDEKKAAVVSGEITATPGTIDGLQISATSLSATSHVDVEAILSENESLKAKVAELDGTAEKNKETAEAERAQRIDAEVKNFRGKCGNAGQQTTEALCAEYKAALLAGDKDRTSRIETIAAGFPVQGQVERADPKGPSAQEMANRSKMSDADLTKQAVANLKERGIVPKSHNYQNEFGKEITRLRKEHASA